MQTTRIADSQELLSQSLTREEDSHAPTELHRKIFVPPLQPFRSVGTPSPSELDSGYSSGSPSSEEGFRFPSPQPSSGSPMRSHSDDSIPAAEDDRIYQERSGALLREANLCRDAKTYEMTSGTSEGERNKNFENLVTLSIDLKLTEQEENLERRQWMITELLAKRLAYSRPEYDSTFRIPWTNHVNGKPRHELYKCKVVNLSGGAPLMILVPENDDLPPIFVFRGTSPSSFESIYNDLSVEAILGGIGTPLFEDSKILILYLLNVYTRNREQPAIICGHSLGGALTQLTTVAFPEYIKKAYAFNSPKVTYETAEAAKKIANLNELLWVMDVDGDIVSDFGGSYAIGRRFVVDSPDLSLKKIERHANTILQQKEVTLREPAPKIPKTGFWAALGYPVKVILYASLKIVKLVASILLIESAYTINFLFQHSYSYLFQKDYGRTNSITADRIFTRENGRSWKNAVLKAMQNKDPAVRKEKVEEILRSYAQIWWNLDDPDENKVFEAVRAMHEDDPFTAERRNASSVHQSASESENLIDLDSHIFTIDFETDDQEEDFRVEAFDPFTPASASSPHAPKHSLGSYQDLIGLGSCTIDMEPERVVYGKYTSELQELETFYIEEQNSNQALRQAYGKHHKDLAGLESYYSGLTHSSQTIESASRTN